MQDNPRTTRLLDESRHDALLAKIMNEITLFELCALNVCPFELCYLAQSKKNKQIKIAATVNFHGKPQLSETVVLTCSRPSQICLEHIAQKETATRVCPLCRASGDDLELARLDGTRAESGEVEKGLETSRAEGSRED